MSIQNTLLQNDHKALVISFENFMNSENSLEFESFSKQLSLFIKSLKEKKVCPIIPKDKQDKLLELGDKLNDFLVITTAKKANIETNFKGNQLSSLHVDIQKVFKLLKDNWLFNPDDLNSWAELAPLLSRYTFLYQK